MPLKVQFPGLSGPGTSIAYHSDAGKLFRSEGGGEHYGPTYSGGDVVGCGVDLDHGRIFFTKNGEFLGGLVPDSLKKRFLR